MTITETPTYTVRAMADGMILSDLTGGDWESAKSAYAALERYYLNLPDASLATGVTLQLFTESTGYVEYEVTFA
ncbi:hypothetical protein SEA_DEJAVU_121 [Microbacterium Phage DejaVu]|nr:hypothetical protein SEA_ROMAN_5 [Microbacterium phage Roman]QDK03362.1 hypothetical protein SEA_ROMAN_121 [Microbacterium phage Roman]WNM66137.1 hypothetical protein SEA_DEJAVU_5 [Microbacterium Phage DejaVu]WNM66253.1 hypothetical protein SEA_DEJAVU_121 [Microbacterium Phage DejaVu]